MKKIRPFVAILVLVLLCLVVLWMRTTSFIYFTFQKFLYTYSILTATFLLSRYIFACFYHEVPINPLYEPGVSIVIPCYNEETWIRSTIKHAMEQDYPRDKLQVIVVDDCSQDNSWKVIEKIIRLYQQEEAYPSIQGMRQDENKGKREALVRGMEAAIHELVVFVDSDSMLERDAIRQLIQPLQDDSVGGVTGRTDVANETENALTRMQQVRYFVAFRIMKAAESCFRSVTCLSGPIACYRKALVEENKEKWLNQHFLGRKATFGDDRALTNLILEKHDTVYQHTAVCHTIVPEDYSVFIRQQMRWKRSWLRESVMAAKYIWRKEPFMWFFFYIGLLVPLAAPFVFLYNVLWVPITYGVFPSTFLAGLLIMAAMMSFCYLYYWKGRTFLYGFWFCLYYEAVLLWQMPVAIFTFWKSEWGTRQGGET